MFIQLFADRRGVNGFKQFVKNVSPLIWV